MMSANNNVSTKKERCLCCQKFILTHNKIMSCQGCSQIFHAECSRTNFEYDHMQDKWSCWQCTANKPKVYNPFNTLVYDKYDPNNLDDIDDIRIISSVLESCAMYDSTQFNSMVKNFRPWVHKSFFCSSRESKLHFGSAITQLPRWRSAPPRSHQVSEAIAYPLR